MLLLHHTRRKPRLLTRSRGVDCGTPNPGNGSAVRREKVQMTNDEIRNKSEIQNSNEACHCGSLELERGSLPRTSDFEFRAFFGIRHSCFGFCSGAPGGTCTHTLPADNGLLWLFQLREPLKCRVQNVERGMSGTVRRR